MKRILPMVIEKVDRYGIWFRGTQDGHQYIFWWNPIKTIRTISNGDAYLGFLPFLTKHINNFE